MGILTNLKAQQAVRLHSNGKTDEALALYRQCWKNGMTDGRAVLAFAVLLLRTGNYAEAREVLVKAQKLPLNDEQRMRLYVDYATSVYCLGDTDKAVAVLEGRAREGSQGLVYETLGYLYVEQLEKKPTEEAFLAIEAKENEKRAQRPNEAVKFPDVSEILARRAAENAEKPEKTEETVPAEAAADEEAAAEDSAAAEKALVEEIPVQQRLDAWWQPRVDKAKRYLKESLEYDDEDPICLDNMGQFCYRVLGDRAAAKEWFDKAIALKPNQIDTLWFLSRYDLEAGDIASARARLEKLLEGRISPLNYASHEMASQELDRLKTLG